VAWTGISEDEAKAKGIEARRAASPGQRAAAADDSLSCSTLGRIASLVAPWWAPTPATWSGNPAVDCDKRRRTEIGKTIHPKRWANRSGMAPEVYQDLCTDLPPSRRR
jgi:hypothetical protein